MEQNKEPTNKPTHMWPPVYRKHTTEVHREKDDLLSPSINGAGPLDMYI